MEVGIPVFKHTYAVGYPQVENFTLPIRDISSLGYNTFIEGISFFQGKLWAEHFEIGNFKYPKAIFYVKNLFLMAENDFFGDIKARPFPFCHF